MKKLHNFMITALILAVISILIDLGNTPIISPKVDNIVYLEDKIKNFDNEIEKLEETNEKINIYTKQYKKRVDYGKNPTSSEIDDYEDNIIKETIIQETPKYKKILTESKPKLVIIIDDIMNKKQLESIKNINLKLTPSVFPISKNNTEMINAVNNLEFFMIHLPLEAKKYHDELDTIKIDDSTQRIKTKISDIKALNPKLKYINNHTGSKFTESKYDMKRLLGVLDNHNITFVDSRTTPDSKLNDIAKEENRTILHRDIFVDNILELSSLNKQLKEGVEIAKEKGYAILIAHPHKETFEALKLAKQDIFKNIDIIYLYELDEMLKNTKISQYTKNN